MAMERLASGYGLLEGARWYDSLGLVFSDMTGGGVYRLAGGEGPVLDVLPHRKGIGGLVTHADGGLVVSGRTVARKVPGTDVTEVLHAPASDERFFNDLTADAAGRIYVGSVCVDPLNAGDAEGAPGRLYQLDVDGGGVKVLADDVLVSNGLGTSPSDDALYHVDTDRFVVWQFALGASGADAASRSVLADTTEYGRPDGLAVDEDGVVWVAIAGGSVVVAWDASGARVAEVPVPHALVTSVAFGGPDRRTMFVLTGVNAELADPDGGCIYRRPAAVAGLPAPVARVRR